MMATLTKFRCDDCKSEKEVEGQMPPEGWGVIDLNIRFFGDPDSVRRQMEVVRPMFMGKYDNLHLCKKCMETPEVWRPIRFLKKWLG